MSVPSEVRLFLQVWIAANRRTRVVISPTDLLVWARNGTCKVDAEASDSKHWLIRMDSSIMLSNIQGGSSS